MPYAIEPVIVFVVAAFVLVLGSMILAQDVRNRTNIAFFLLAGTASIWGFAVGLYLTISPSEVWLLDLLARLVYFAGTNTAATFLYFALFLDADKRPTWYVTFALLASVVAMFLLHFMTDTIIAGSIIVSEHVRGFKYGPLRFLVDIELWGYFGIALIILSRRYRKLHRRERQHLALILVGTYTTLVIAGITNDILLTYGVFQYLWIGPASLVFWLSTLAYAIAKLQLFNIRLIAAEVLIILLWIVLLVRSYFSQDRTDLIINVTFFLAMLVCGVFLIRSIVNQVKQRELIEKQGKELTIANGRQEVLLNFISHEVKGYFAKSEAVFAGIGEGDFGQAPQGLNEMAEHGLQDVRMGAALAINMLEASSLKRGTMTYQKTKFDLYASLQKAIEELRPIYEEKGLRVITYFVPRECLITGDEVKLRRHVFHNIIDNSIRYTQAGEIRISGSCKGGRVIIVVEDTGVGINAGDMSRLFTEGGHGKNSLKVNVHSTGYGLYIAKQIVVAHNGTIDAFSEGENRGSRFKVALPTMQYED